MIYGRGTPVFQNGFHEAGPYQFPNGHSVTGEWNYLSPMSAVWQAWKLRGELIYQILGRSNALPILQSPALESCSPSSPSIVSSQKPRFVRRKCVSVHFDDYIELKIGVEDSWTMYSTFVVHDALQFWNEKPWSYTPKPKSLEYSWRKLTNLVFPFSNITQEAVTKQDHADKCVSFVQTWPVESLCSESSICSDSRGTTEPDWILKLQKFASCGSQEGVPKECINDIRVQVWLVEKHRQTACSNSSTLSLPSDSSSWKQMITGKLLECSGPCMGHGICVAQQFSVGHQQDDYTADLILTMHPQACSMMVVVRVVRNEQGVSQERILKAATSIEWNASPDDLIQHASAVAMGLGAHNVVALRFPFCQEACPQVEDGICVEVVAFHAVEKTKPTQCHIEENVLKAISNVDGSLNGAPLSSLAVLSSSKVPRSNESDKENRAPQIQDFDQMSVMQRPFPGTIGLKSSPHDDHQENMVAAFQQDRTGTGNLGQEAASSESSDSEGRLTSESEERSNIRPPSDTGNRQEVVLFHLDDHPIRAYINWNSYEEMMHDIAYTFAVDRDALVDAYEIAAPVSDVGEEAVPTIAHIIDDVPLGRADRLALFDVQYHAHSIELNFRLGPVVVRSVLLVPPISVRNDMLKAARVDRFCRAENNRCLVFHNEKRWPDYDEAPRAVSHGDYIRIAVPPSERFACSTMTLAEMMQQGSSDQQIYDTLFEDEVASNVSPSMLNDSEVRGLAPEVSHQADDLHNLQTMLRAPDELHNLDSLVEEEASDEIQAMQVGSSMLTAKQDDSREDSSDSLSPVPEDWMIDLKRVVQGNVDQCQADEHHEFLFSIYTWLVDHEDMHLCREPKIVVLGDDPSEWAEDITEQWRFHIQPGDHVFYDLVTPSSQRIGIEEHLAHHFDQKDLAPFFCAGQSQLCAK